MQTIVKAANDAALLAMMPHLIGMHPRNSVVLLGFCGNRTYGGLRVDLPVPPGSSRALVYKRMSKALVGMLGKMAGADGVAVAVVTDESFGLAAVPPQLEFVSELTRCIDRSRFALKAVLCRASDGWAPYFTADVPVGGYPLSDIVDADIASQLPADLPELFDAAATPSRVPDADEDLKHRVMSDFYAAAEHGATELMIYEGAGPEKRPALVELVERALDFRNEDFIEFAGLFLAVAQNPTLRDIVMLQWASDAATGTRLWTELNDLDEDRGWDGSELLDLLSGKGARPDAGRLKQAISLVLKLAACADDSARLGPLCILAWLYWAMGRGSIAGVYLDEAARIDPECARVVSLISVMSNGVMPAWLFEDEPEDEDENEEDDADDYWDDDEDDAGWDDEDDRNNTQDRPNLPF